MIVLVTSPPPGGKPLAFYDGHCRVCTSQSANLARRAHGRLTIQSFQEPGALEPFAGLTHDDCMRELKLVDVDGRVYGGAAAIARAVRIAHPILGQLARLYDVPGFSWLFDRLYRLVARYRYRLFGRSPACENDACSVHFD